MVDWNLGSVAAEVLILVPDVPSTLSGTPTERIADRKRVYVQNYTGASISSSLIPALYQEPILLLTASEVTKYMDLQGGDYSEIKLGDFTEKKGSDSNLTNTSKRLEEAGMEALKVLGRSYKFHQAFA